MAGRRLAEITHNSPYVLAQRQQLLGMFGEALQRERTPERDQLPEAAGSDPIQRVKLTFSTSLEKEKKQYYDALGYISKVVQPWLTGVPAQHPEAATAARNALLVLDHLTASPEFYEQPENSWSEVAKLIVAVNSYIGVFPDWAELPEEQDPTATTKLNIASAGSKVALALEQQIADAARIKGSAREFINGSATQLNAMLTELLVTLTRSENKEEILQIFRFVGTFEFKELALNKNTSSLGRQLEQEATSKALSSKETDFKGLSTFIKPEWKVTEQVMALLDKGLLQDAPHGAETERSAPVTVPRFAQTVAELQLMTPILDDILRLGVQLKLIGSPDDFLPLIVKVLEGAVRRFKAISVLELLLLYEQKLPLLLELQKHKRITDPAWTGLQQALRMAISGVGHRAKEQKKMLLALVKYLDWHDDERCIAYEPQSGDANYDAAFVDTSGRSEKIVEVETIPTEHLTDAYTYYKKQYQSKLKTIKHGKELFAPVLYLVIPPRTRLPLAEIQKIENDTALKVLNIDQIQPLQ